MTVALEEMRRPRIKPEHRAYRTVDGHVRIGGVVYGIGAEVADPDGWVWTLVRAMDGSLGARAVAERVRRAHPGLAAGDVIQAMTDLLNAGFVDDAGARASQQFSEREQIRYGRGVTLLRWMDRTPRATAWEAQQRLRAARVLLLGVGGTGGFAAQALVASGVGRLHCVDPDVVELSNLNRQPLFGEDDVGRAKVEVALAALRGLNSDVTVTGERREVADRERLAALLAAGPPGDDGGTGYDLLVLAADRPRDLPRWANRACLAAGLPWVDAGYRGPLVTVGVQVPGRGACWECHRAGDSERRDLRLGPGQDEDVASPRMDWNPANAVTAGLSGGLLAHAALAVLTGVPAVRPGFRIGLNLMMVDDTLVERYDRRPDCPACGGGGDR